MKKSNFTLLEVLTALVILALGASGLLWQLSVAADRAARNAERWEQTHELTQAAEFLLLHGTGAAPDETALSGEYQIDFRYEDPQLPDSTEPLFGRRRLRTLVLTLRQDGEEIDQWKLDCWTEEEEHVR